MPESKPVGEHTGASARIWLFLLKEGGRWDAGSIARAIFEDDMSVHQLTRSMAGAGMLKRFERQLPKGKNEYAVTPDCKVPRDVTIAELQRCLA
jgi:predicted transcriptional regulator